MPVVNSVEAIGAGITVAPNLGDVVIRNTGILDIFGGYGISSTYEWNDISGYVYTLTKLPSPSLPSPRSIQSSPIFSAVFYGNGNYTQISSIPLPASWVASSSGVNVIEVQLTCVITAKPDGDVADGDGAFSLACRCNGNTIALTPVLPVPGNSMFGADYWCVNSYYNGKVRFERNSTFDNTTTRIEIFALGEYNWNYFISAGSKNKSLIRQYPLEAVITCLP
jgi:hypothetical protein